jgi:hypothetical protein
LVKESLQKSQIYTLTSAQISEQLNSPSIDTEIPLEIASVITKQFTPVYLQEKFEKLIDDTEEWVIGKSQTPPVLSFSELKTTLHEKNPQLLT